MITLVAMKTANNTVPFTMRRSSRKARGEDVGGDGASPAPDASRSLMGES